MQKQISNLLEEIFIRPAHESDAADLAILIGELGYPTEVAVVQERLKSLIQANDQILVADRCSQVIGMILMHRTYFLNRSPDGRVSTLVVSENYRGLGIGAQLIANAELVFRQWGCGRVEVTSGTTRTAAHKFYNRLGYSEAHKRFIKTLSV